MTARGDDPGRINCPKCGAPEKLHQDIAEFIRERVPRDRLLRVLAAPAVRGKATGQGGVQTSPQGDPITPEQPPLPDDEEVDRLLSAIYQIQEVQRMTGNSPKRGHEAALRAAVREWFRQNQGKEEG